MFEIRGVRPKRRGRSSRRRQRGLRAKRWLYIGVGGGRRLALGSHRGSIDVPEDLGSREEVEKSRLLLHPKKGDSSLSEQRLVAKEAGLPTKSEMPFRKGVN